MNDEQHLLASAYLDDALTGEERARAEADPDVMAAVERLRDLRGALTAVEPADPARREAAISAALDAFDTLDTLDTRPAPVAPVTPLHSRRRGGWLVSAAAAALVVIVAGGIIAVSNDDGGDDDDAGGATATVGDGELLSEAADTVPGATLVTQSAADARESEAGGAATTSAAAADATAAPGTTTAAAEGSITATYSAVMLTSPDDLAMFADDPLRVGSADDTMSVPACDEGTWLGSATYLADGVETPVEVFLSADADEVLAVDAVTCDVVARTPAP